METCRDCKLLLPRHPSKITKHTVKRFGCKERGLLRTGDELACMLLEKKEV